MFKKSMVAVVSVVATALLLGACSSSGGSGGSSSTSATAAAVGSFAGACKGETLKIGQVSNPTPYYFSYEVANDGGYFAATGLKVQAVDLNSGSSVTAAMTSGSIDVAMSSFGSGLAARQAGAKIVAIAPVVNKWALQIVLRKDVYDKLGLTSSSSELDKAKALRGLKIGITGAGSGTDQVLRAVAGAAGMNPDKDLSIVSVGDAGLEAGFIRGDLDGFVAGSPHGENVILNNKGVMLLNLSDGQFPNLGDTLFNSVLTTSSNLTSKAEELKCFLAGLQAANNLIASSYSEAQKVAASTFSQFQPDVLAMMYKDDANTYPTSIVINPAEAQNAYEVTNKYTTPLTIPVAGAYDTTLANAVLTQMK
jgi:NitT/TauT family transport system substrate-binding protein